MFLPIMATQRNDKKNEIAKRHCQNYAKQLKQLSCPTP